MKKHYVLPNNVHDTEAGMPEYCMFYDSAEVDARIAELKAVIRREANKCHLCYGAGHAVISENDAASDGSGKDQDCHACRHLRAFL